MFYKYADGKYWAMDSARDGGQSIGYTEDDLRALFAHGSGDYVNSVWWIGH
jgi:hypothetical protein